MPKVQQPDAHPVDKLGWNAGMNPQPDHDCSDTSRNARSPASHFDT